MASRHEPRALVCQHPVLQFLVGKIKTEKISHDGETSSESWHLSAENETKLQFVTHGLKYLEVWILGDRGIWLVIENELVTSL